MSIVNRTITYKCDECGTEETEPKDSSLPIYWYEIFYTKTTDISEIKCVGHLCPVCICNVLSEHLNTKFN